jgi:hypothetical protein
VRSVTNANLYDDSYVANTHVHSLLACDDEIRFPDGRIVDEEDGTLTLEEYRQLSTAS